MKEIEELLTDEQINKAWGYANFGDTPKRDVIKLELLKCASGYYTGHTATCILAELGLTNMPDRTKKKYWKLTQLGREYLYLAFSNENA